MTVGKISLGALVLALSVGCAHKEQVREEPGPDQTEFRLSREDVIEVTVWKEPELSRTLPIRPDGRITLPLLGDVQAEGLTPGALEKQLAEKLAPLVRDPRVTVIVRDVNGQRVFVTGQVGHPGAFPIRSRMELLQALALAGGLAEFADKDGIAVLHADGRRTEVDYDDLINGKRRVTLNPGDTVVVR